MGLRPPAHPRGCRLGGGLQAQCSRHRGGNGQPALLDTLELRGTTRSADHAVTPACASSPLPRQAQHRLWRDQLPANRRARSPVLVKRALGFTGALEIAPKEAGLQGRPVGALALQFHLHQLVYAFALESTKPPGEQAQGPPPALPEETRTLKISMNQSQQILEAIEGQVVAVVVGQEFLEPVSEPPVERLQSGITSKHTMRPDDGTNCFFSARARLSLSFTGGTGGAFRIALPPRMPGRRAYLSSSAG